jgi:benzil reductase ((S)-benzoin forming)
VSDARWPLGSGFADATARRTALAGKVAVITGASRGVGAGMAAHFAAAGLHLGLCARHRPDLVARTRPRAHDGRIDRAEQPLVASVDVADVAALDAFAQSVIDRFGRIDLWVNNAGVLEPIGPLAESDPVEAARHLAINLTGPMFATMIFARHVRSRPGDGVLINISSGAGSRPYSGWALYCASKAGLERMTEAVDLEERAHGLRAYAVAPGVVDTDMQAMIRATDPSKFPEAPSFVALKEAGAFNTAPHVAERLLELAFGDDEVSQVRLRVPNERRPGAGEGAVGSG